MIIIAVLIISYAAFSDGQRKIVNLPDLPGYVTLKCDFHIHTVFSDGNVWPIYRIAEAYITALDAIALVKDSAIDVIEEAVKQDAFIQWNHPGWKAQQPDGIPRMYDIHYKLIEKGWLHGIEFFNDSEYYPLVMTFCKKYNLAVMGNSDNHGVISEDYRPPEYTNRPMTLVFAKERTHDSLKEAMFAGRTLVYFKDMLAGKEEYAKPFFYQCISIGRVYHENDRNVYFEVTNKSDIPFYLENGVAPAPSYINLAANSITRVVVSKKVTGPLIYDVRNVITGEDEVLKVELKY